MYNAIALLSNRLVGHWPITVRDFSVDRCSVERVEISTGRRDCFESSFLDIFAVSEPIFPKQTSVSLEDDHYSYILTIISLLPREIIFF